MMKDSNGLIGIVRDLRCAVGTGAAVIDSTTIQERRETRHSALDVGWPISTYRVCFYSQDQLPLVDYHFYLTGFTNYGLFLTSLETGFGLYL